ncbi:MAG: hypothetical protein ACREP0_02655 [Rhodanobacteraceae bacterium]
MKSTGLLVWATVAAVALGVQGCAGTNDLVYANGAAPPASHGSAAAPDSTWEATGPNSAITTQPAANQPVVKADTKDNFEAVQAAIRKQMQPGGRWQYVDVKERATIDGNFADMQKLFDQYGSVDKMDTNAKMRLVNDQSSINAILTKKDGDKLICQSETPVGSHLPVRTCKTFAQVQAENRQAQQSLMQLEQQGRTQNVNPNGSGH